MKPLLDQLRKQHTLDPYDKDFILKLIEIIEEQSIALRSTGYEHWPVVVATLKSTESKLKALVEGK